VQHQTIPTNGGYHLKPWTRLSQTYISVVNVNGWYTDVYVYSGSLGRFVDTGHRLHSSAPQGADVIDIAGDTYMAVSAEGSDARIYWWNDTDGKFYEKQRVAFNTVSSYPQFFTIGSDTLLAIAFSIFRFCNGLFVLS
jgi:hypothetical protein